MSKEQIFNRLVENALDFLAKAISELNDAPKYSMINFHASVELFVKARLMAEHWTLVIGKRQDPDWDKFLAGDFQSVSLDESANRLTKIVRSGLSKKELEVFRDVAKHRNKMVHFFHEAHSGEDNKKLRQNVVKQQLNAWYFLHRLITEQWSDTFSPWSDRVIEIDKSLRELHEFLDVVFHNLHDDIEKFKASGVIFRECPSCGFEAQQHDDEEEVVYESECLVCGLNEKYLQIECTDCEATVFFEGEGFATCGECGKQFEPEDLAEILTDDTAAYISFKDGDDSYQLGNCSNCDGYHTVVQTDSESWICASCFRLFESIRFCGWCNEPNTGDMEHSYVAGCNHCDGMAGWTRDD